MKVEFNKNDLILMQQLLVKKIEYGGTVELMKECINLLDLIDNYLRETDRIIRS